MKRFFRSLDAFIIGGFTGSLFSGIINPSYIKLIVVHLDMQVIAVGSFCASFFPLLTGLFLENPKFYRKLYSLLPAVMSLEIGFTVLSILFTSLNMAIYYVAAMIVLGLFTSTVMYLLQGLKDKRYGQVRAAFERRYAMADALGYLVGSAVVFFKLFWIERVYAVLLLGLMQTIVIYLLFLYSYARQEKLTSGRRRYAQAPASHQSSVQNTESLYTHST